VLTAEAAPTEPTGPVTEHIARIPLWLDLAAVAFGAMQGGAFGAQFRDESNFDLLGVAVFAILVGLGGGIIRDLLLNQVPAALRNDSYLLTAVGGGLVGMLAAELISRQRWPLQALDAGVVGLFVVVGAVKTESAGLPGAATILLGTITGIGGGVMRDLLAQRPVTLVQRDIPYALVALLGAITFVLFDWLGAKQLISGIACLLVVVSFRLIALSRGWQSPAPIIGTEIPRPSWPVRPSRRTADPTEPAAANYGRRSTDIQPAAETGPPPPDSPPTAD
jgi:uncharacterized membrane protein YeiH